MQSPHNLPFHSPAQSPPPNPSNPPQPPNFLPNIDSTGWIDTHQEPIYRLDPAATPPHIPVPRGCSSVVERHVANVKVARSNRVTRFPAPPSPNVNPNSRPWLSVVDPLNMALVTAISTYSAFLPEAAVLSCTLPQSPKSLKSKATKKPSQRVLV
jgi:hypothetical protein